jgi:hypothetical protein
MEPQPRKLMEQIPQRLAELPLEQAFILCNGKSRACILGRRCDARAAGELQTGNNARGWRHPALGIAGGVPHTHTTFRVE